ncbi:MAG: ribosome-associated translation inhibitor RaiA [Planctomycetes bacterium]|nr:ribosome-associated translation inhibitor RaiA [Planctomycetota bacterium]
MQIVISGRHTNLRDGEKKLISEKLAKYERKVQGLTKVDAIVNVEGDRHGIELILHVAHSNPLVAKAEATSNAGACDVAISKLDNLVSKLMGKRNDHHR